MIKRIVCEDEYEAQKLASLIYAKDSQETFIAGILDIVDKELIISLKDKSAHSVLLKNKLEAESFADFIQSVIEKKHGLVGTRVVKETVEITKE